jgi:DNA-binding NarL/FixJ family response regulator
MSPAERLRLLVVDDSAVAGSRLMSLLASIPDVELLPQASSVASARRAFYGGGPDVVVTDFSLPDGTGLDVIRYVKKVWPWTVVIVLTNESLAAFRRRCLEAGADFVLDKTVEVDDLLRIVENLLVVPPLKPGDREVRT